MQAMVLKMNRDELDVFVNEIIDSEDQDEVNETDIFKKKRPRKPTDDPNPVRMPGRKPEDVGAGWGGTISPDHTRYVRGITSIW